MLELRPECWYEEEWLREQWGWSSYTLARARKSEGLRCRQIGRRRLYRGEWLLTWLSLDA